MNFNTKVFNTGFQKNLKGPKMADVIQVHLPADITPVLDEIKAVRAANFEPTTYKAIVIDALKEMHSKIKEQQ